MTHLEPPGNAGNHHLCSSDDAFDAFVSFWFCLNGDFGCLGQPRTFSEKERSKVGDRIENIDASVSP